LLARSRYLFIRRHRPRFADRILAELRGIIDEAGGSPFWDGLAGRFFGMSFQEADQFNAVNGHQFVADLMPKHPIYTAMLTEQARAAIGLPHPSGRAAMRMLEHEGFRYARYCDIFDGGPTMTANTDDVRAVRDAVEHSVIDIGDADGGEEMLLASGTLSTFRCIFATATVRPDGIVLPPAAADALAIDRGDTILTVGRV
jgi:arginine N-succinyltransferase